jgi:hypothetical protein
MRACWTMKNTLLSLALLSFAASASAVSIDYGSTYLEEQDGNPVLVGYWRHAATDAATEVVYPIVGWGTMTLTVENGTIRFFFQPTGQKEVTITLLLNNEFDHERVMLWPDVEGDDVFFAQASAGWVGQWRGNFGHRAMTPETGPGAGLLGLGLLGAAAVRRRLR